MRKKRAKDSSAVKAPNGETVQCAQRKGRKDKIGEEIRRRKGKNQKERAKEKINERPGKTEKNLLSVGIESFGRLKPRSVEPYPTFPHGNTASFCHEKMSKLVSKSRKKGGERKQGVREGKGESKENGKKTDFNRHGDSFMDAKEGIMDSI